MTNNQVMSTIRTKDHYLAVAQESVQDQHISRIIYFTKVPLFIVEEKNML